MIRALVCLATLLLGGTLAAQTQHRINVQPECGTQYIIDYDFQLFFKLKSPDGKVYSIMVRLSEATNDQAMALAISQAINDATGQSSEVKEADGDDADAKAAEDVVLEAGWCFVEGSLYKYKLVSGKWKSSTSGQCDIDIDYGDGYTNETQNNDPGFGNGKPFNEPPSRGGPWNNRNW